MVWWQARICWLCTGHYDAGISLGCITGHQPSPQLAYSSSVKTYQPIFNLTTPSSFFVSTVSSFIYCFASVNASFPMLYARTRWRCTSERRVCFAAETISWYICTFPGPNADQRPRLVSFATYLCVYRPVEPNNQIFVPYCVARWVQRSWRRI